ncbi:FAD-binding oxidoreductase [Methyloferula stellata]|uniref:FAD-binding oxidoreductase n=1 Tax=Methyloferula stellata TaxID=876270 RepID=UPI0003696301|nr:FAD-binding oxidoreductase [Methyloferula stellata]
MAQTALSLAPDLLQRFAAIAGEAHVLTRDADMAPYLCEPRELYRGRALCVVRPASTQEVAAIVALCNETGTSLVPQGGNTGLVGGQTPDTSGHEIVLSLTRLNRLRELDLASNTMIVEAGMILANVQAEADRADRFFPLSLAAEGSCTIGGNLATNAGGTAVIAYGSARDLVLGLEVVLADGRILSDLSKLRKDNTGYDLKHLFMGSEGTLGIITAAVLKLFPKPRAIETAFVGLASPEAALDLLSLTRAMAGPALTTFELISARAFDFVLRHGESVRPPLQDGHAWYVLLELTSPNAHGLSESMLALLEAASAQGTIENAAVAATLDQRQDFWRLRELIPDVQKREGGSIKHDVSLPISAVPTFLKEVDSAVTAAMPGARLVPFGHLGDGNIHCNVSQPEGADKAAFLARWAEINAIVHAVVTAHRGSISAEHGIGQLKRDLLPSVKDPVALDLMRVLKKTLDPKGILNPGKVL